MKKQASLVLVLTLSLLSPTFGQRPVARPAPQQQEPDQDEVVRISTNLVQVDAVVTDKKGHPLTDLRPEEFQILEDDREQKITNFSYVALAPEASEPAVKSASPSAPVDKKAPPPPPIRLRPEQVRRTIALVVDDLGLSFVSTSIARQALREFVDKQMQPGDLVAIIRTGGGMGALQQFTSDKRQLYAAIERVRWNPQGRGGIGIFSPVETTTVGGQTSPGNDRNVTSEIESLRENIYTVGTLGALNFIVRGLRELPGRKSIVLISEGFSLGNDVLKESQLYNPTSAKERGTIPASGAPGNVGNLPGSKGRVLDSLRLLIDLANRSSVVIYALDPRGLIVPMFNAEDNVSGLSLEQIEGIARGRAQSVFFTQGGLGYLAEQTGGFAVVNQNDLNRGIKRVLEDQKGYYLIGYRPDESTFDQKTGRRQFHKISVKVTRPGARVRSRSGFYGIADETSHPIARSTGRDRLLAALSSPFSSGDIHLRLTSLFGNAERNGSFVRSLLNIEARDLTFTDEPDDWHKATFEVVAITFGDNGRVVDQVNQTYSLRMKGETYRRVLQNGFVYYINIPVKKAGAYQLRTALRDTVSDHVGSASQFIEVPDLKKNRLTLSGLILSGVDAVTTANIIAGRTQTEMKPVSKKEEAVGEPVTDPQAGPAVRRFHPGMTLQYGYVIYNAQLDRATGQPQLQAQLRLFRDGQQIHAGKTFPLKPTDTTDPERIDAAGVLQLSSNLAPGEYVLQIVVTDPLAKEKHRTATQWIDFEIVK